MNPRWISVGIIVGTAVAATVAIQVQPVITGFRSDGALTWTGGYPGGTATLKSCTNLSSGAWVSETNVPTPTGETTVQLAFEEAKAAFYKVEANPPEGMVLVPGGLFQMGDDYGVGGGSEAPVHSLHVSDFYMGRFEVTRWLYQTVKALAETYLRYTFENPGSGTADDHPVTEISWYDALKYCNALSEIAGLRPCYYTTVDHNVVYKDNTHPDLSNACVDWTANGYRLPTEAEWEKAARGGLTAHYFPWVSLLGHLGPYWERRMANFQGSGDPFDDGTTPVGYYNGGQVPAGGDMGNGYGLYDMAGNVWEWCWDRCQTGWYADPAATHPDCQGPATGNTRVLRGGSWMSLVTDLRCATRGEQFPDVTHVSYGFRCVRAVR